KDKGKDGPGLSPFFANRIGAARESALREGGGTEASEAAVARGLKWLMRQQLSDGRWTLGTGVEPRPIAATAFGLLPFFAAGKTHKADAKNPYDKVVDKGLKFLIKSQDKKTGYFGGSMYEHALATTALCEAYALSSDPELRKPAQQAINLIVN